MATKSDSKKLALGDPILFSSLILPILFCLLFATPIY